MTPLGDRQEQILRKRDCKLIDMEHRVSDIFVIYWLSSGKTTLRLNSFNLFRSRRTKAITIKNLMRSSKDLHMTLFQLKTEDCQEKQDLKKAVRQVQARRRFFQLLDNGSPLQGSLCKGVFLLDVYVSFTKISVLT